MTVERLSPLDASFLQIEDGVSHMHIASVAIFEGPEPPFGEIARMIEAKLPLVPRYRQVVRSVPLELGRPVWVDDPHFNLEYHVRHTALPAPGGEEELRRLVGRVMAQQLDRSKPLWEIWIVEGLEDGQWAMLSKTHHAMVDGVAGTDLLAVVMDTSPEPSAPRAPSTGSPSRHRPGPQLAVGGRDRRWPAAPTSSSGRCGRVPRVPRQALRQLGDVARGLSAMAGLVRPTPVVDPQRAHRPAPALRLGVHVGRRHQGGSKSLGGTFNDVVLAAITRGFRDLLLSRGESVDRVVRTLVPVSVRPRDASGSGRRRRHLREQGVGHVRRAAGRRGRPRRAAACDQRSDGRA